ncbi:uncharacterized protein LOC126921294 [Bombus affinis]|uniref:uncharacterized protein LOC126921294 n=1 Tax=Bombus affinis TaxID=309941 RepID=UPI0021B7246C|nr:uncharacterized protein LOC126921294 [Bombus affinis]
MPDVPGDGHGMLRRRHLGLGRGRRWCETLNITETAVACAVRAIQRLGLSVSPAKSEAMWFGRRRRGAPPPGLSVNINGEEVPVRYQMNYLALIIDSQWSFRPHFEILVPRVIAAANALCGLLPNIGGAVVGVRRLYEGVVRSRILYGAPVWAEDLMASYELQALALRRVYEHLRDLSSGGLTPSIASRPAQDVRTEANLETWERWRSRLLEDDAVQPHRGVRAVLPNWEAWRDRGGVPLTPTGRRKCSPATEYSASSC